VTRVTLSGDQFILFVLLLKLGVMAAMASLLITSSFFKRLVFLDKRDTRQNWQFAVIFGALLAAGTAVRVLVGYEGMDLSLSGTLLVGLLGGMVPGLSVGFFVSLPPLLRGEWLALPFTVLCGFLGGLIRARTARRDEFWDFSPLILNNLARSWRNFIRERRLDSRAAITIALVGLEAVRHVVSRRYPAVLFSFYPDHFWITICIWLTTVACVGIPLKIWNNTRVEALLEEQRAAAMQARFDALRSQINPHFLFNTLNAATSLIWNEPEKARWILVKLSGILRRLLRGSEDFVPLSREIEFIDDYLSLEVARFGAEKLRVEKDLDPRSLDVPVPSMMLQPLVENAVRHGLSPKVGGGVVRVEAARDGARLRIAVRDNGLGFKEAAREGIGLRNVRERLTAAYGEQATLEIESARGGGTSVIIDMPVERGGPGS
jgi:two-component system LytT family sensor kinase